MTRTFSWLCALALFSTANFAADAAPGPWRALLDDKLSNFDVYLSYHGADILKVIKGTAPKRLKPIGLNPKVQNVFTVVEQDGKPVLRISGESYGCLQTREAFSNYHLRLEMRWGEKKWVPRLEEPKDSGILYHSRGAFGVDYWKSWALSQEFQVIEHGLGEYWTQASSAIDIRAFPRAEGAEAPRWDPAAPWMEFSSPNNHALAGSDQDAPEPGTGSSWCASRTTACTSSTAGGHGAAQRALQGRRQVGADDRRQTADPERGGRGVLPRHRTPPDPGHAGRARKVFQLAGVEVGQLEDQAALDDHLDVLQRRDVGERIAAHRDQVAELPRRERADVGLAAPCNAPPLRSPTGWPASGVMPRLTMMRNCRAFRPCG